jgi:hypothetical protein
MDAARQNLVECPQFPGRRLQSGCNSHAVAAVQGDPADVFAPRVAGEPGVAADGDLLARAGWVEDHPADVLAPGVAREFPVAGPVDAGVVRSLRVGGAVAGALPRRSRATPSAPPTGSARWGSSRPPSFAFPARSSASAPHAASVGLFPRIVERLQDQPRMGCTPKPRVAEERGYPGLRRTESPNPEGVAQVLSPPTQSHAYRSSNATPFLRHTSQNSSWKLTSRWCSSWRRMYSVTLGTCVALTENTP